MNKLKGMVIALSLVLLALIVGIFMKEQKSFAEKDAEIKKIAIKEKEAKKEKETEAEKPSETKPTEPKVKDPYADAVYDAGEVSDIIRKQKEYTGEKVVFLTFDDGPDTSSSPRILKILNDNKVPGTFFLQGQYINDNTKDIVKQMHDDGHTVAAHSYGHDYSYLYPGRVGNVSNIISDFDKIEQVTKKYLGDDFKYYTWRYPGGHMSWNNLEEADAALKEKGVEWIDWNNMTGDAEPQSRRPTTAEGMFNMVKQLTEGSTTNMQVILMHDNVSKELTIQALPQIIAYYKDLGYKFGKFK